ncbi:MAG: glycosyltransferase family 4 protein [Oscillatoria sp. PMC 1051.18]|nr:glycosyltransferase family 4 protein [Oscillatoria sp. PMC 1050.18]MEC5031962.1 glycosyltransferase family 4 protein [Oscillatoria sp. PMC 1051.18]
MKIALVCPYDYEQPGGVQSHIRELAQVLGDRHHQVKVITPKTANCQENSAQIIRVGNSQRIKFQGTQIDLSLAVGDEYQFLKETLQKEKFDVIHYHTIWNPLLSWQILLLSKAANVATFHDTPRQTLFGKLAHSILMPRVSEWLLKHYLNAAIAVSEIPATYLRRSPSKQISVIPNGIFLDRFSNNSPFSQYLDGKLNLLFLGRLEARKGIFYLLKAFVILKQKFPQIRLIIAGDGYQKNAVNQFIAHRQLTDVILLGFISEEDKPKYYATCDIYCSPAFDGESFGIVLVEAMASGKPAAGAANLGYKTILTGKGEELLVIPKSVDNLVRKLAQLIENQAFRSEMGAWGKAAAQQYDWQVIVKQIEKVYQQALEKNLQAR